MRLFYSGQMSLYNVRVYLRMEKSVLTEYGQVSENQNPPIPMDPRLVDPRRHQRMRQVEWLERIVFL
jgi:hypothetical protein